MSSGFCCCWRAQEGEDVERAWGEDLDRLFRNGLQHIVLRSMGRRRVPGLRPLLSRMQTQNSYDRIQGEEEDSETPARGSRLRNFWGLRIKKTLRLGSCKTPRRRRRWGVRVAVRSLRIRLVTSPLVLLAKLRDRYVRMMIALEGRTRSNLFVSTVPVYPLHMPGRAGTHLFF